MGENEGNRIQKEEMLDEKDELAIAPTITLSKAGKSDEGLAKEQRETYGRDIAKGMFTLMDESEFRQKVGLRLAWMKEKKDLEKEIRIHRKSMPSTASIIIFAKELVNAMGGDLDNRDDPQDVMTWEMLTLAIARDVQLATFHPEIEIFEMPRITSDASLCKQANQATA